MATTTPPPVGTTVWLLDPADDGPSRRFPGAYKVIKNNPRRTKLQQADGTGIVNADRSLISTTKPAERTYASHISNARVPWAQGTVVRWDDAPPKAGGHLFVIIKDQGDLTVTRMVLLGNTTGRYWGRVPAAALTEVKLDEILRDDVIR